jgi:hypothetical protein
MEMDETSTVLPTSMRWSFANVRLDTDDEKANFQDPQNLYAYRRKMESASNGIFKNLVFDETVRRIISH